MPNIIVGFIRVKNVSFEDKLKHSLLITTDSNSSDYGLMVQKQVISKNMCKMVKMPSLISFILMTGMHLCEAVCFFNIV